MNRKSAPKLSAKTLVTASLLSTILSGCDSIPFIDTTPDYKSAGKSRPLEVPPDLTTVGTNDTYSVPGGSISASDLEKSPEDAGPKEKILPTPDNVRLERAGSQRWLVVKAPPEKVWPAIREFWGDLGFAVRVENPETGVMETEWVDPSTITKDENGNYLDKFQGWLDKLNSLNNRQKFRTRIDRGQESGETEIYMSHRSVGDTQDDGITKVRTGYGDIQNGYGLNSSRTKGDQAVSDAEDIDAELLRRLMVKLGIDDKKSKTIMTTSQTEVRAVANKEADGTMTLTVNDPFDRAWRRVGLALDRVGFVVEDRDRSSGIYYVRYNDIEKDDGPRKKGLLDSLKFWGDDDPKKEPEPAPKVKESTLGDKLKFWQAPEKDTTVNDKQYRIKVEDSTEGKSKVSVVNKDGTANSSSTATRILNMLFDQLR